MIYVLSAWAKEELDEAAGYYEKQSPGLGLGFLTEFEAAIQRIMDFPEAYAKIFKNVRLCPLHRFPYGIIYYLEGDTIRVVAVMHLHRKPGYWKTRLKKMDP